MYRGEVQESLELFSEFIPFDGKLDPENRWLKTRKLIPWKNFESKYASYFSDRGLPAKNCHLVIGLLLLKHMNGFSDKAVVALFNENPYMQALWNELFHGKPRGIIRLNLIILSPTARATRWSPLV